MQVLVLDQNQLNNMGWKSFTKGVTKAATSAGNAIANTAVSAYDAVAPLVTVDNLNQAIAIGEQAYDVCNSVGCTEWVQQQQMMQQQQQLNNMGWKSFTKGVTKAATSAGNAIANTAVSAYDAVAPLVTVDNLNQAIAIGEQAYDVCNSVGCTEWVNQQQQMVILI